MGFATDEERLGDLLHPPRSAEGFRVWVKEQAVAKSAGGCFTLAIEAVDTGQIVGAVGSHHADPHAGRFEYGITMGAGHRRKGYAAEAVVIRRRARELKDPAGAHRRLEQEIQKLDAATAKDGAATDKRIQTIQTDLRDGLARITMDLNRRTDQSRKRKAELPAREQSMIAAALEPAVRQHVEAKLRATSIQEARSLPNMGAKTVGALVQAGIRMAADFTGCPTPRARVPGAVSPTSSAQAATTSACPAWAKRGRVPSTHGGGPWSNGPGPPHPPSCPGPP
ncbi:GNAT family N-acetyltransferase [Streptomyces sp. DHE7-1]|nr:GNAT family N-acetyltransferase [Streptomyces sp. DHE7-1]